jgi:hypothetical protein
MIALRLTLAVAAIMLVNASAHARAPVRTFPRIVEQNDGGVCRQALAVARLAFESSAPKVADAAPAILKDGKPAFGIILAPNGRRHDEQGFIADEQAISQSDETGDFKKVFLQKTPVDGFRFAVTQEKMNWQGDWHALFVASAALEGEKLAKALSDAKGKDASADGMKVVFKDAWQQPWLVRDPQTNAIVAIDTQHPAEFLPRWTVYMLAKGTAVPACHIAFGPPAKNAVKLLPAGPLRQLAGLLDDIIGIPSYSEGTYNATARVRLAAANAWINLALRPWAMGAPYNTPAEVKAGLKHWSKGHATYRAQYRRFNALYPRALRALATHYRVSLKKQPREARTLAKKSLDRAIGMNFTFSKSG